MKCLSPFEIEQYILNTPTLRSLEVTDHVAACAHCNLIYHTLLEEQGEWSQALFEEKLPDSFTSQVMASIEFVELEKVKVPDRKRKNPKLKRLLRLTTGAALLLVVLSAAILYSVPTLADTLRSLFVKDNVDIGLLRAQEFGLVEHPNIKVKDKGYTVKIDEAVADPTRVIVALQLFGPDGKHEKKRLVLNEGNSIAIKDDQGKILGKLSDIGFTNDFYYLIVNFSEPLQTDRITVDGHITELGNVRNNIPLLKGDWNFNFSMDMTEANKQTSSMPLSGSYTSPDGLTLTLKRLTHMVQGVRFEFDTQLSEEALTRSPGELWKQQGLKFHFEDTTGEEIHSVNARKFPNRDSVMSNSNVPGETKGLMHWSYTFKYLPQDTPYTFVLDGYFIPEKDGSSVQFEPAKLKEQPIPFAFDGDELMLNDFTVESSPDNNVSAKEGVLHFRGRLRNEFINSEWIFKTLDGKEYKLTEQGALTTKGVGWKDGYIEFIESQSNNQKKYFQFRAEGLTQIPDQLQLIRTIVNRLYTNVDWSVPIMEASKKQ
ncbi:hypothetical protein CA600_09130 [Paenibacillus sp. VTT E-133280]|uniref:DUF4179 domain-containing protein n=1 Tax=Paenibacillus sp. VTT E-133280 TaxID=1986222 RepID=UPI000BA13CBD|nr:DUF4179 domain-containing protein [Paenibacillus sp. VTT E-133280]OZQ67524.1 hypothetical protein CA600_09130 [Paenibacillus sp. VTT E-133280]